VLWTLASFDQYGFDSEMAVAQLEVSGIIDGVLDQVWEFPPKVEEVASDGASV
jgi:hypothetical protein